MINIRRHWRQFTAWAIGLKHKFLAQVRLKLIGLIILTLFAILAISTSIVNYGYHHTLENYYRTNYPNNHAAVPPFSIEDTFSDLKAVPFYAHFATFIIIPLLAFLLARYILLPMRDVLAARRRFIADAAHELRTPLSIMKTNTEVSLMPGVQNSSGEMAAVLEDNLKEIDRMTAIIKNLINISSFDEGVKTQLFAKVDLKDSAIDAVQMVGGLAKKRDVKVTAPKLDSAFLWGNSIALGEMTLNLMKNAVLYSPKGGEVTVTVVNNFEKKYADLTVRDNGTGIAKKDLPHIFDPFFRADKARAHGEYGGTGLGLAIVARIVKQHKGVIRVQSDEGKGSSFMVRFYQTS